MWHHQLFHKIKRFCSSWVLIDVNRANLGRKEFKFNHLAKTLQNLLLLPPCNPTPYVDDRSDKTLTRPLHSARVGFYNLKISIYPTALHGTVSFSIRIQMELFGMEASHALFFEISSLSRAVAAVPSQSRELTSGNVDYVRSIWICACAGGTRVNRENRRRKNFPFGIRNNWIRNPDTSFVWRWNARAWLSQIRIYFL